MPGTGHSHRYKSSISNRNSKSAFQVLAPWNKGKLGKPGQVPRIGEGGNLQFSSHLDSVTLSANSVHFKASGGNHSLGVDKDGCLSHTVWDPEAQSTTNFEPRVCFNHGIKTNSIAPESSSVIPTAVIDASSGICTAPPLPLTGMSGFIRIPATNTDGGDTIIKANSTLWFAVKNDLFAEYGGGGMFFLQFSLPDSSPIHFGDRCPLDNPCNFIYPGGITVMWSGGVDWWSPDVNEKKVRLFGLQNPNPHDIDLGGDGVNDWMQPCISWLYFTPYSSSPA